MINTLNIKKIKSYLSTSSNNISLLSESCSDSIDKFAENIFKALSSGKKILFCGNGGSAADSQHIAAELVGRYKKNRDAISAIALTTDTSILTAVANDFGYENIFSRQIEALGVKGDILVAISTSGNSKNIINAVNTAKRQKLSVLGLTGKDGGFLKQISDLCICVPSDEVNHIQEMHITIGHLVCSLIEENFNINS